MIHPANHIADEILSGLIDDQLAPDEASQTRTHLETCSACGERLDELQSLVGLLHRLPSLETPRDFSIGPRLVLDPPNVVRLRHWYALARAGAATLAATFVLLSAGALYVGSQPVPSNVGVPAQSQFASAPGVPPAASPAAGAAAPARNAPPVPSRLSSDPAARSDSASAGAGTASGAAAAPVAPPAAPARATSSAGDEATDQVTAATSVQPLPTLAPSLGAVPSLTSRVVREPLAASPVDAAGPLWTAAASVGLLAVLGLLVTLIVRHRLRAASIPRTE